MFITRRMEYAARKMYYDKKVRGFLHQCVGQEAIAVGMQAALRPQDTVITAYRDHGWAFARGVSIHSILAELAGERNQLRISEITLSIYYKC